LFSPVQAQNLPLPAAHPCKWTGEYEFELQAKERLQIILPVVGYIALFGTAVETGVVMVVYLRDALNRRLANGQPLKHEDIEEAAIEGAVQ